MSDHQTPDRDRHVVILAGGKGVRLRPYTTCIPKPLVPIGDEMSILEIVMRQLRYYGFRRATLAIGHLGHIIRAYIGDGSQWDIEVDYFFEESPLGTMGPLVAMRDHLPEHFLAMNGDILTDLDYGAVLDDHVSSGAPLSVATYERQVHIDFGVLELEGPGVVGFIEKPTLGYSVSMGVYGMSRDTLAHYAAGEPLGFDSVMLDLLSSGQTPRSHRFDGYWLDIGRPEDYEQANLEFPELRRTLLPETNAAPSLLEEMVAA
jgi:NDP-sugar pyrophosphorylase family protein